jgi:hypothetical protein
MEALFDNAQQGVKMYCHGLSAKLTNRDPYLSAFENFLKSGKKLKLLVETEEGITMEAFQKVWQYQKKQLGLIECKKINEEGKKHINDQIMGKCNFSVFDDKMFRLETNPENFKAFGSFNNVEISEMLTKVFDEVFNNDNLADIINPLAPKLQN